VAYLNSINDPAWYNEIDPYAAQWLRNLINAGELPPGDVDERSIEDVRPDDLRGYTQCHFFAGVGLWPYSLRRARWPDNRPIWTASCPCQPFSSAGKGDGFGDERHLWPALAHLVSQRRPSVLCGEQVASKDGYYWRDLVQTDMEGLGYAFWACVLPIAGVGGPGERHRQWWVAIDGDDQWACDLLNTACGLADPAHNYRGPGECGTETGIGPDEFGRRGFAGRGLSSRLADHTGSGRGESGTLIGGGAGGNSEEGHPAGFTRGGVDIGLDGAERTRLERYAGNGNGATGREGPTGSIAPASVFGGVADPEGCGIRGRHQHGEYLGASGTLPGEIREQRLWIDGGASGGDVHGLADTGGGLVSQSNGRPDTRNGDSTISAVYVESAPRSGPLNGFWGSADWLYCTDGRWRPVEPGTFPLAYGLPRSLGTTSPRLAGLCAVAGADRNSLARAKTYRVGTLKCYGNAISPEPAIAFIESWMGAAP
jgi:DNA (cytosine-5)-methyltransferase 1